ncbi:hypothetical protein MAPG_01716 [Magnaporthiopsis poae ATCC 64411]|uniref:Uncharacterized protein n=1 Tax=Magnaporthiopsis poae (strain ATCC 64411 / 73-15) TaxID=644358 RepID=A0A0C4DPF2_MAGP6|nr:hypothetical protein MAPG_01716 [Magnaporthiopsis poae ATCC 64411]
MAILATECRIQVRRAHLPSPGTLAALFGSICNDGFQEEWGGCQPGKNGIAVQQRLVLVRLPYAYYCGNDVSIPYSVAVGGHRHDREHVTVFVQGDWAQLMAALQHGGSTRMGLSTHMLPPRRRGGRRRRDTPRSVVPDRARLVQRTPRRHLFAHDFDKASSIAVKDANRVRGSGGAPDLVSRSLLLFLVLQFPSFLESHSPRRGEASQPGSDYEWTGGAASHRNKGVRRPDCMQAASGGALAWLIRSGLGWTLEMGPYFPTWQPSFVSLGALSSGLVRGKEISPSPGADSGQHSRARGPEDARSDSATDSAWCGDILTVILIDWDGNVRYTERSLWDEYGNPVERGQGDVTFRFHIDEWHDHAGC